MFSINISVALESFFFFFKGETSDSEKIFCLGLLQK